MLDLTVVPAGKELESLISAAAGIAHQSDNNCILLLYPVQYSGISMTTLLASQRKIEDRLMAHKVSIEASKFILPNQRKTDSDGCVQANLRAHTHTHTRACARTRTHTRARAEARAHACTRARAHAM